MAILSSPTASQLLVEVRDLLNQPDSDNTSWSDEALLRYLDESVRRYFTVLIGNGEGQFDVQTDLDSVADVETIDLPTDFFKVKALYKKVGNEYVMLNYRNNLTEGYSSQGASNSSYVPSYYFRGNQLVLRPIPATSETAGFRLEYISFPDVLVNGGDVLDAGISPIFRELIVTGAAYKAKVKEAAVEGGVGDTAIRRHLMSLYLEFKESVAMRSLNPTSVRAFNPETGS